MVYTRDDQGDRERRARLEQYVHARLLNVSGRFVCSFCETTRPPSAEARGHHFTSGAMPRLGRYFGLTDDEGRTFRSVVVGQERASSQPDVSMEMRSRIVLEKATGHSTMSPHLRGTNDLLAELLVADGRNRIPVRGGGVTVPVLDACCLTNATLCSSHVLKSSSPTTSMPTDRRPAQHCPTLSGDVRGSAA